MHPDSFIEQQHMQYKLSNLLFGVILLGLVFLGLYLLWRWCSENDSSKRSGSSEQLFMKPVYAHEIEPGIVVLQSEDGQYFKIMKEYDMSSTNRYGSVSCTRPEALQPSPTNPHLERTVMNASTYTPAAFNIPSAPQLVNSAPRNNSYSQSDSNPPPYNTH